MKDAVGSPSADKVTAALERVRSGDVDAYGEVVDAFRARLRLFLAGYVPNPAWVDDLAQQAFVTAYQSLADFQLGTDFYAWLRKIAYNHLRTELDRSRRRRRLERDQVAQALTDQLEQLQEEGPDAEVLEALRECLRLLREDAREVVERYYRDGTPLGDIARAIGRTAESLKVSLFKIRAQLRECMLRKGAGMEPEFP